MNFKSMNNNCARISTFLALIVSSTFHEFASACQGGIFLSESEKIFFHSFTEKCSQLRFYDGTTRTYFEFQCENVSDIFCESSRLPFPNESKSLRHTLETFLSRQSKVVKREVFGEPLYFGRNVVKLFISVKSIHAKLNNSLDHRQQYKPSNLNEIFCNKLT
jgi:hypothetical protein